MVILFLNSKEDSLSKAKKKDRVERKKNRYKVLGFRVRGRGGKWEEVEIFNKN